LLMKVGTLVHNNKLGPGIVVGLDKSYKLAFVHWTSQDVQCSIRPRRAHSWNDMTTSWSAGSYGDVTIESLHKEEGK